MNTIDLQKELTGIPDLDIKILLELSDKDLTNLCSVSEYIAKFCQADVFGRKK